MAIDTVRDVLGAVPGATPTSTFRTKEKNASVGGAANSFHTRGSPDDPRAVDLVPAPGETMAQLEARVRASGVKTTELLNEGDHIHVAVDGQPREAGGGTAPADRLMLNPTTGRMEMARIVQDDGERMEGDVFVDGRWHRNVDGDSPAVMRTPEPLDTAYAERVAQRESLALDQEDADLEARVSMDDAVQAGVGISDELAMKWLGMDRGKSEGLDRGMGQRFVENVDESFQRSAAGYLDRMLDPQMDGIDPVADFFLTPQILEGGNLDKLFDAIAGDARGYFRSVNDETRRDAPAIKAERERRERYARRASEDPVENIGDFLASMAGLVGGGGVSPDNWVAPGRTLAMKLLSQGAIAGGVDAAVQGADIGSGIQDKFNVAQTVTTTAASIALPAVMNLVGKVVTARRAEAAKRGLAIDPVMTQAALRAEGEAAEAIIRETLGNPTGPRFKTKVDDMAAPVRAANITPENVAAPSANVFDINLARIDTPEDVQAVIVGIADKLRGDVNLARRATRSFDTTAEAAGKVDWVSSMAARRTGQAANAEEITAYRMALNASATKVRELANRVLTGSTTPAEKKALEFAFRRSATIHAAIQNEFMGARAEAGRALGAMRMRVGTPESKLRQIDSLIADYGATATAEEMAKRVLKATGEGDIALNQLLRNGWMAKSRDVIKLVYTNGLLSALGTPIINMIGTPIAMTFDLASRSISPRLATAFGGESVTQTGEAWAKIGGYQMAIRDMFALNPAKAGARISADGFRALRQDGLARGMAPGIQDAGEAMGLNLRPTREESGLMGGSSQRPLSAAAWRVQEDSVFGRILDVVQMAVELPSNVNGLADDFYKVMSARGELHSQAFRQASTEGLQGKAAETRMQELVDNPTDAMMKAAERAMEELTFTRSDGGFEKWMNSGRRMMDEAAGPVPAATYLALPFVRTPLNLASLAVRSGPLAPMSARFRASLRAGGAEAETAKAQVAVGTALWVGWLNMALQGQISGSGPGSAEQKQAMMRADESGRVTWQPYSVKFGDRWYSYERADPIGTALSLIGDFAEIAKNDDWTGANQQDLGEIAANAIISMGSAFFDKTVFRSAFEFTEAMTSGDVALAERYFMNKASSTIPMSSGLRMFRRGQDKYMRETHNVTTALMNTIPGLSDNLPASRDLWGKPRTYQTGIGTWYDAIVPVQTRESGGSAVDQEILLNGVSVRMPPKSLSYRGVNVSLKNRPDIYERILEESGQPAFAHLQAVVTGNHPDSEYYISLPDGNGDGEGEETKGDYIKSTMEGFRKEARMIVMEEYAADIEQMANESLGRREKARGLDE